eukprot:82507-Pelagomonas_calceolata.AAC.1
MRFVTRSGQLDLQKEHNSQNLDWKEKKTRRKRVESLLQHKAETKRAGGDLEGCQKHPAPDPGCEDSEAHTAIKESRYTKKRYVYAGHSPRALRKGLLTNKLARASPEVPQDYTTASPGEG